MRRRSFWTRTFFATALLLLPIGVWAEEKPPADVRFSEKSLRSLDCEFMVEVFHAEADKFPTYGFCLRNHTEVRGMYAAKACQGVLVEPETHTVSSFYATNSHWGLEGDCDSKRLKDLFSSPKIETTNNPITATRRKRQEGFKVRLVLDQLDLWKLFEKQTRPTRS